MYSIAKLLSAYQRRSASGFSVRPAPFGRRCLALVAATALVGGVQGIAVQPVSAQPQAAQPQGEASTILGITTEDAGGTARVTIRFSGPAPRYEISGDGTANVRLLLRGTFAPRSLPPIRPTQRLHFGFATFGATDAMLSIFSTSPISVRADVSGNAITLSCTGTAKNRAAAAPSPDPAAAAAAQHSTAPRRATRFRLRYADVSEVAGILVPGSSVVPNDVFVPQTSNLGQPNSVLGSAGGGISSPTSNAYSNDNSRALLPMGERVSDTIAIDRRMNAIIVIGTPEETAAVQSVIELVDVPIATVLLEVEIVELTDSAARDVGIDFSAGGTAGTATLQARTLNVPDSLLNLQAAIYAQVSRGEGRIVAKPRISTLDGKTASILTGDAIPIITNISFPTSGSPVVQQQVQYVNVGVSMQLRPQVGDNNVVTSHVYTEVSSVTGYVNGNIPRISQRQASTIASVGDGQTLILGGLIQHSELKTIQRIPFFSDLPLIGNLFKLNHSTSQNTNLYLLITPHVTRPS